MAENLEDAEFWLPSEFLTDDDILLDKENINKNGRSRTHHCFPADSPYDFEGSFGSSSVLSSPVESVVGSTEVESDEDDPLYSLTRHFARSASLKENAWVLSNSPQSMLSAIDSWSSRRAMSRNGSSNGTSQGPSPTSTPLGACCDRWDLIYQAAGQLSKLKTNSEVRPGLSTCFTDPAKNPSFGLYKNHCLPSHIVPRPHHLQPVRQNQMQRQQSFPGAWDMLRARGGWVSHQMVQRAGAVVAGVGGLRCGRTPEAPQPPWNPLQVQGQCPQNQAPHVGYGMKADLPGGSAVGGKVKKECAGTGVFLPRRYNGTSVSRKKPVCPVAAPLLPAKVVLALNNNLVDFGGHNYQTQTRCGGTLIPDYDLIMARRNLLMAQQRRSVKPEGIMNQELLPPERTY